MARKQISNKTKEEVIKLFQDGQLSVTQIANMYDISPNSVYLWARQTTQVTTNNRQNDKDLVEKLITENNYLRNLLYLYLSDDRNTSK